MRNQNAYLSDKMAEKEQRRCWDAFCQSGSIADYLQYRHCCEISGELTNVNSDTSDRQRTGDP